LVVGIIGSERRGTLTRIRGTLTEQAGRHSDLPPLSQRFLELCDLGLGLRHAEVGLQPLRA
jgi:hypothetical protein